jgi:hypothetical protein
MADAKLTGKKVLMAIPPTQFRDEEFFEPKKILEAEGATVTVASTTARMCHGTQGGFIHSTIAIADAKAEDYDACHLRGPWYPTFLNDKNPRNLQPRRPLQARSCRTSSTVVLQSQTLAGKDATVYFLPQAIQSQAGAPTTMATGRAGQADPGGRTTDLQSLGRPSPLHCRLSTLLPLLQADPETEPHRLADHDHPFCVPKALFHYRHELQFHSHQLHEMNCSDLTTDGGNPVKQILASALCVAALTAMLFAQVQPANTNMQILREKLKADKKLVVAANMDLKEAEARGFWPIYDEYQKELQALDDRLEKTVRAYGWLQ